MRDRLEELLRNWAMATEPYTYGQWNVILEGVLNSLRSFFNLPFVFEGYVYYGINDSEPGIGFPVIYKPENPLIPRILGRCGVNTWVNEDGSRDIAASVSFYFFQGETRLIAEKGMVIHDYIFTKNEQGEFIWESIGWFHDYGESEDCTWDDLKS